MSRLKITYYCSHFEKQYIERDNKNTLYSHVRQIMKCAACFFKMRERQRMLLTEYTQ